MKSSTAHPTTKKRSMAWRNAAVLWPFWGTTTIKSLLLLLLSCFSRVRLCTTPQMAAHQAPPSLGFSRQEHWSGLPFPSPKHESEKWKWSHSVVSDHQWHYGLQPSRLLRPWDFPGKSTGVGCNCLLTQGKVFRVVRKNLLLPSSNFLRKVIKQLQIGQ